MYSDTVNIIEKAPFNRLLLLQIEWNAKKFIVNLQENRV